MTITRRSFLSVLAALVAAPAALWNARKRGGAERDIRAISGAMNGSLEVQAKDMVGPFDVPVAGWQSYGHSFGPFRFENDAELREFIAFQKDRHERMMRAIAEDIFS